MDFSFKIEGMDNLKSQLQEMVKLGKEKQLTQNALFYASKPMFDEVKQNAPKAEKAYFRYYKDSRKLVRPGTLRRNVARKRIRLDGSVGVGIYIKPKAFYFRFMEKGTPTQLAVPFIRPAYDLHKEEAVKRFKEKYAEYVQKIIQRQKPG